MDEAAAPLGSRPRANPRFGRCPEVLVADARRRVEPPRQMGIEVGAQFVQCGFSTGIYKDGRLGLTVWPKADAC